MKTPLFLLGLLCTATVFAQTAAAPATSAAPAATTATADATPAASTPARPARPAPNTHGLDMRTQSGPAETMSTRGYSPPIPVDDKLPTIWVIGDSTVRNGSPGNGATSGQWGWGAPLTFYFDAKKINVVNRALGGTSSHSFYQSNWPGMRDLIKKGDFVIMQFGANDSRTASLPGFSDDEQNGLHSFGWYMKQYVIETRAKGATPIICSLTPRVAWTGDTFRRDEGTHVAWAAEIAKETNASYINLYELIARQSEKLGAEKTAALYPPAGEKLHTGWDGAVVNAECVIGGLKTLKDNPLTAFFTDKGKGVANAPADCVADNTAGATSTAVKPAEAKPAATN